MSGMTQGSVTGYTVDAQGNVTYMGTGYSQILATALAASRLAACGFPTSDPLPTVGQTTAPYSPAAPCSASAQAQVLTQLKAIYGGVVGDANAIAGIVGYIQANAVVPAGGLLDSTSHAVTGTTTVT